MSAINARARPSPIQSGDDDGMSQGVVFIGARLDTSISRAHLALALVTIFVTTADP